MAIKFAKTAYKGKMPNIWPGTAKPLPGGFKPEQTFAVGTVIPEGTPVRVNFDTMSAAVCKTAMVLDGGTTKEVRVAKGTLFGVGDKVLKVGGTSLGEVASIDRSNTTYDVVILKAAYIGLSKGDALVEGAEINGTNAPAFTPNAVTPVDKEFTGRGIDSIDAAYEAIVLYPHLSFPILDEWKQGFCLKDNPSVKFIKQ